MGLRSTMVKIARPAFVRRQSVSTKESLRWRSTRSRLSDLWACPIIAQSLLARGCWGDLLPPSPPAEQATTCQDQSRQSSANEGTGDRSHSDFSFDVREEVGNLPRGTGVPINERRAAGRKISVKPEGAIPAKEMLHPMMAALLTLSFS